MAHDFCISELVSPADVEKILAAQSGWTLAQALMTKIQECRSQGARGQMTNAINQLFVAGNQYLYWEHLKRLESSSKSDATGEY